MKTSVNLTAHFFAKLNLGKQILKGEIVCDIIRYNQVDKYASRIHKYETNYMIKLYVTFSKSSLLKTSLLTWTQSLTK